METEWPSKNMEISVRSERLEELCAKEEALEEAQSEIAHHQEQLSGVNAQIARLRAALKPFAMYAHDCVTRANEQNFGDGHVIARGYRTVGLTVGDMRAALKTLGEES